MSIPLPSEQLRDEDAVRIWFRFLRVSTRIRFAVADRLKSLGISVSQCDVLTTLTEADGLSQKDLATRLYVTKGNISGLVDRLVEAELVERRPTTADRRSHGIFLTPAGRQIAARGIAFQREFVAKTFGRLPAEQRLAFEATLIEVRNLVRSVAAEP